VSNYLGTVQIINVLLYFSSLDAFSIRAEKLARLVVLSVFAAPVLNVIDMSFCPSGSARPFDIAVFSY